jgi:hypothetical protein
LRQHHALNEVPTMSRSSNSEDPPPQPPSPIALEALQAADFERPIRDLRSCDLTQMMLAYQQAGAEAVKACETVSGQVFAFLSVLCGIRLKSTERGPVFDAMASGRGFRTAMPENFRGEQTDVLSAAISLMVNPVLRARIADVAWTNNRRDAAAAAAAIAAYCEGATATLRGELTSPYSQPAVLIALPLVRRAAQIEHQTTKQIKGRPHSAPLSSVFVELYEIARKDTKVGIFLRTSEVALAHRFKTNAEVAADAEALLAVTPPWQLMEATNTLWQLAIGLYEKVGDKAARQRCLAGALDNALALRDAATHATAAKVMWVKEALKLLLHIDGREEQERELEVELRRLQKLALREMKAFPVNVHIEGASEETEKIFSQYGLSEALRAFALLDRSRDPAKLREDAIAARSNAPLLSLLGASHLDREGRTAAFSAGARPDEEPGETWYRREIGRSEGLHRAISLENHIEPARVMIHMKFGIEERHLAPIVGLSSLVPDDQKPILCLGFARFFQGDMMSAAHLLVPQMESAIRHLLKMNGVGTGKLRDDATEEDYSLSKLFERFRPQLDGIFGVALAAEIDNLFNTRPGPALRHEMAHGQVTAGECFAQGTYYGCWLIYRLCCLLVFAGWDQYIAPQLADAE